MHPKLQATLLLATLTALATLTSTRAEEAKKKINYKDDITPVLQASCFACHNNDNKKGGLVLDNYASLMQGGGSGEVVEAGDSENSRLYLLVAHEEEPTMPPNAKLPDEEIELIKKWIDEGAPETAGSVVVMKEKPKLDFAVDPAMIGKPQGEPAMPSEVSTDPLVVTTRPHAINAMAASPWAPLVAIAQHKQAVLYNTETQRLVAVLPFPEGSIATLKFSRDGDLLLAGGGRGGQSGRVVVWDVKSGERLFEVGREYDTVLDADISPDRSMVALGGPSKVLRVYSTSDDELVYENRKHTDWVTAVAFSPDGVLLASGDRSGGLLVWEGHTGREFYDLQDHKEMITDLDWRLDSNVLASVSTDGTLKLWEMEQGKSIKSTNAHAGGVESVRFSKSGQLVTTGRDLTPRIWKPDGNAESALEAFGDLALSAVFTFDESAVIAGDFTGEVRVFEVEEGKQIGTLIANPEPLAVRLEKVNQALAEAQAQAEAANKQLADLQAQAQARAETLAKAEQAVQASQQAAEAAKKAQADADAAFQEKSKAQAAANEAAQAAVKARDQANQEREAARADIQAKAEAAQEALATASKEDTPEARKLAEQAESALAEATKTVQDKLPDWSAAIEAAESARLTQVQAASARIQVEASLPLLRQRTASTAAAIPLRQAALKAAQEAREAADKAVADKAPEVQALNAKVESLKAEADALAAEQQRNATEEEPTKAASLAP